MPHVTDGALVLRREWREVRPVVAREPEREARLAVGWIAPKAQRHPVVAEVVVPGEVVEERVAEQRHEVAAAAARTEERAQQEKVGKRVQVEVWVVEVAANVDLDSEAKIIQSPRLLQEAMEPVQHHLQLQLIEAVDERDEVELAELRMPLQHRAQRRATRLLEMMEEDDRALWQQLVDKDGRLRRGSTREWLHHCRCSRSRDGRL